MPIVFFVGRRTDKTDIARLEIRLQHVRRIHRALTCGTSTNKCMYLIDIHHIRLRFGRIILFCCNTVHNHLDAILEVTTILRASQQRTHVQLIDLATHQSLRHSPFLDHPHKAPDQRRLAHARLSNVQRIVLVSAAQHLNGTLQFHLTTYQGILLFVKVVHACHQLLPGCLIVRLFSLFL